MFNNKKLYVANISFSASESEIYDHLSQHAKILDFKLIYGSEGHRGFCFAEMENEEIAAKTLETLNESEFMGRTLYVSYAKERR